MQMFVKNNMQWFARRSRGGDRRLPRTSATQRAVVDLSRTPIISSISPPRTRSSTRIPSARSSEELVRADQLELPFLVLHPGAHLGAGEEAGLEKIVESIDCVLSRSAESQTRIALETTAGQGSCLGNVRASRLHHQRVREPERLCVCLDTAHVFAAGYDIARDACGSEKISRIRSRGRPGSSRRNPPERFQNRARFTRGST